ncbi:MAG TPA: glycosyltransferase [Alphaproteobacteria bacterium]|nr:glycosyltransferase [Alphaproteobacteria bacterium]
MSPRGGSVLRPSVLVINPDLPRYGVKAHEFCNTIGLSEGFTVGLVTQLAKQADWADVRRLESHGISVYVAEPMGGAGVAAMAEAAAATQLLPHAKTHPRIRALLRGTYGFASLFLPRPSEVYNARRTLANMAGPLRRALAERRWDAFVIIQSSFAEWLDWLPAHTPAVIALHDIRTMIWHRHAEVAGRLTRKFRALVTAFKYRIYEGRYLPRFASVICLTEVDAKLVERWFGIAAPAIVPLPVDLDYYRPNPPPEAKPNAPTVLFPGVMNHPPNIDGALWLARAIFPRIRKAHPEAHLVIAGMLPPPEITALDGRDGISVTGEVADMRPFFRGASVVAVPLRVGSGARNKILEAWASARPVVSTTIGAEGLATAHGRDLLIADSADDFAAKVDELLEQPERQAALVAGGLASVRRHAPAEVGKRYRAAVAAVTAKASAGPRGPMRICIDMRWMNPGSAGGIEQQARAFVGCLLEIDRVNRYTLILPPECTGDFDLRGRPNYRIVHRSSPAADLRRAGRAVGRRLGAALGGSSRHWPDRWALGDLHRLDADLAYSFPGYINPDLWELRHVVSVPDIQHEFCPEFFSPEALAERSRLFDQTMERAEHICAMSDHTRQTLVERLGIEADRISVTHLAADADFRPAAPGSEVRIAVFLEHRYGLRPGSYFFFPAHTWPHKNHVTAIRALARLRERYGVRMVLACTGGEREAHGELVRLVAELGLQEQVRFPGYVRREDMPRLYHGAAALVFPSRFEGFGMPVVEAMACGTPVLCADATSLPEIAGDAGLCLPPLDVERWAEAMHRIVTDAPLRAGLIARGFEQVKLFSWRRYALSTLAVLAAVHDGPVRGTRAMSESAVARR